jgi:toluene monooxygenase system protein E
MAENETPKRNRRRTTTWSEYPAGKKPSEYETVTHGLNYHFRRDPVPFEMDPGAPLNRWYLKHREGSPLNVEDWSEFRDPSKLTYRAYVAHQRARETYLDSLIEAFETRDHFAKLSDEWGQTLDRLYLTSRFSGHILQMASLYVSQMAPTSYITVAFHFQGADDMRRVQRCAYLAKSLSLEKSSEYGDSSHARKIFEEDEAWQPLRELLEKMLIAYDWGEAYAALALVAKPAYDAVINDQLGELARINGDELLTGLTADFALDTKRHQDTARAVLAYVTEKDPSLADLVQGWVDKWQPLADSAVEGLSSMFETAPTPIDAETVQAYAKERAQAVTAEAQPA